MHVSVDGRPQKDAKSWGIDDFGALDLYSENGVVMKTINPYNWNEVERVLENGEDWSTFSINVPAVPQKDAESNADYQLLPAQE